MAHRNDLASVDFSRVYAVYAGDRKFMEDAWDEFCALTDLSDSSMETEEDRLFIHSVFSEWVLFDYDIHRGKTPLEKFITWPPAGCGSNILSTYAQAATTNFTSTFRIMGYDVATKKATLENVADGLVYRVYDPDFLTDILPSPGRFDAGPINAEKSTRAAGISNATADAAAGAATSATAAAGAGAATGAAASAPAASSGTVNLRGLICARIMRIRGTWLFAGNLISYAEGEPSPEELAAMRDEEGEHGDEFVELVRTIYGRAPLSVADSVASGFSALSADERTERLKAAQEEYAELQRGLELEADWDALRRMIREEDGEGTAVTLMDTIVGQERVDAMGEDELVHTLRPILAAWNLLPHDILNGLTPVEDYEARYPINDWDEDEAVGTPDSAAGAPALDTSAADAAAPTDGTPAMSAGAATPQS